MVFIYYSIFVYFSEHIAVATEYCNQIAQFNMGFFFAFDGYSIRPICQLKITVSFRQKYEIEFRCIIIRNEKRLIRRKKKQPTVDQLDCLLWSSRFLKK